MVTCAHVIPVLVATVSFTATQTVLHTAVCHLLQIQARHNCFWQSQLESLYIADVASLKSTLSKAAMSDVLLDCHWGCQH